MYEGIIVDGQLEVRMGRVLPLIVGEGPSPTYVGKPHRPLFGRPARVLCALAGLAPAYERPPGLKRDVMIYSLLRHRARLENLCAGEWDQREAESRAMILSYPLPVDSHLILLGRRVARAFGLSGVHFFDHRFVLGTIHAVVLPHPSGLNRLYNDPLTRERAGETLRRLLDVPNSLA